MEQNPLHLTPEERTERHAQRTRERKRKRRARRRRIMRRLLPFGAAGLLLLLLAMGGLRAAGRATTPAESAAAAAPPPAQSLPEAPALVATADTQTLGEEIDSDYAVVLDLDANTILAEKNADAVISPASMTKILTVLTAAEHVTNLEDLYTIPAEVADFCYCNDCSVAGFSTGETVSVRDLFYAAILPSGADGALSLALYTSGSQEAFAALMNETAAGLGLSDAAHFTNCVGLYDPENVCTVTDMAKILRAAVDNDLCRQVLAAHTYTTSATAEHPEGMLLSNWFLRRIEDKDTGGLEVTAAKTGYVTQSGSCAASAADGGRRLLCVTAMAGSAWRCIYDHAALYARFADAN